ncbi:MAG: iron ABC transporter permease, partial [Hyphomicrobiales bacterium]|nr:iron ABC transporter permease [Hyphomicrobiales bacterium]
MKLISIDNIELQTRRKGSAGWNIAVLAVALVLAAPVLAVVTLAFTSSDGIWAHLAATVLPGYIWRSCVLVLATGALCLAIGTGTAWLVTMCSFPGRKIFQWALLIPLAIPTYIVAYVYVDLFEFSSYLPQ